jgi:phosphoribosylformimino-5-aminoimidazole carboxamide ribotide isomerase
MIIFPAIDLYGGKAVRLLRGDYAKVTVYSDDPVAAAAGFRDLGATHLHLVDLEGARTGETPAFGLVRSIKASTGMFCEVGGGIRTMEAIGRYADAGIDRIILGTSAATVPGFAAQAVQKYGSKIAVGVDVRDGRVAVDGWTRDSGTDAFEFCRSMCEAGVGTLICTDISRDGAMRGTNRELYRDLSDRFSIDIVASGGVSSMEDVTALRDLGLYGAIIGRACYTGDIDLRLALEAASC